MFNNWFKYIKFCKKPASGGMPANENKMTNNESDSKGWFFDNPDKSSISSKDMCYFFSSLTNMKIDQDSLKYK